MDRDDNELKVFQQIIAGFETPAFLRRARCVEDAWQVLVEQCRRQRESWLEVPRLRLATLAALAGDWATLAPLLDRDESLPHLRQFFDEWQPKLRRPLRRTTSQRKLSAAMEQMNASFARFNQRWEPYIAGIDLREINRLRAGYNQYYVLEKECMVRSAKVAHEGFRPLAPASTADLLAIFPLVRLAR